MAEDLAAVRQRLYQAANQSTEYTSVWPSDLFMFLQAFDTQAARLAAQQPVIDAVLALSTYSRETVDAGVRRIVDVSQDYEEWLLDVGATGEGRNG